MSSKAQTASYSHSSSLNTPLLKVRNENEQGENMQCFHGHIYWLTGKHLDLILQSWNHNASFIKSSNIQKEPCLRFPTFTYVVVDIYLFHQCFLQTEQIIRRYIGHKRDNNAYINILSEKSLIVSPSNSKMLSYGRNYNESLQKNDANSS